ncbi:hypothetical protein DFP72DRAFT_860422 [Ephemerocybe angulata]|uniref:Uncharacterized protein n=1 Tax=Ephemerocybe angulata TaxID=980116 RepID=A0A8H6LSU3_9AGAR|nr:hypothetical protein DFP72DRAFT_860422 [Tulosesus angulatus]
MATKSRSLTALELPALPSSILDELKSQEDAMIGILMANARRPNPNKCSNCVKANLLCPGRTEAIGCIYCRKSNKAMIQCTWVRPGFEALPVLREESENEIDDHQRKSPLSDMFPSASGHADASGSNDRARTASSDQVDEGYELVPRTQTTQGNASASCAESATEGDDQSWVQIKNSDIDGLRAELRHQDSANAGYTNMVHPDAFATTHSTLLPALDGFQTTGNLPPPSTPYQIGEWDFSYLLPALAYYQQSPAMTQGAMLYQTVPMEHATAQGRSANVWPPPTQNLPSMSLDGTTTASPYGHQLQGGVPGASYVQGNGTMDFGSSGPLRENSNVETGTAEAYESLWTNYDLCDDGSWVHRGGAYAL